MKSSAAIKQAAKQAETQAETPQDPTNPAHYRSHASGVECIQITEHLGFCLGNAVKYIWRAEEHGKQLEDLKKARWYLDREIARLEKPIPYRLAGGAK